MESVKRVSNWERQAPVKYECQKGVWKRQSIDIDDRPLSEFVSSECQVYNSRGVSSHCKHIHGLDYYDKCKVATALRWRTYKHYTQKCKVAQVKYQIVDITTGQILYTLKSKEVVKKCESLRKQGVNFTVKQA